MNKDKLNQIVDAYSLMGDVFDRTVTSLKAGDILKRTTMKELEAVNSQMMKIFDALLEEK